MGLITEKEASDDIKRKLKLKGKISVWKYLSYENGKLVSPYYGNGTPTDWMTPGVIVSNRAETLALFKNKKGEPRKPTNKTPTEISTHEIQTGFHVYTTYQAAKNEASSQYGNKAIVRFEAFAEDFVAASFHHRSHHVVFAKLTLKKEVLQKTLEKLKGKKK